MLTVRNHSIVSPEMMPGICRIERLFPRLERCDWILVVNTNLKLSSSQCKYTKGKQLHTLTVLFASAGQTDFQCICAIQSRHMHPSQKYTAFCKLSFKVKVTKWIWQWTIFLKSRCLSWLEWEHEHQLSTSRIAFFPWAEVSCRECSLQTRPGIHTQDSVLQNCGSNPYGKFDP